MKKQLRKFKKNVFNEIENRKEKCGHCKRTMLIFKNGMCKTCYNRMMEEKRIIDYEPPEVDFSVFSQLL